MTVKRSWMIILWLCFIGCFIGASTISHAQDQQEQESETLAMYEQPIYVPVRPAFVVNYGGVGKLKYLKLEISIRAKDTSSSNAIRHHMPLIRDYLVRLFSRQMDEDIDTMQAKESLRQTALTGVQNLLLEEDGEQGVTNLLFNNFVIQR